MKVGRDVAIKQNKAAFPVFAEKTHLR